MNEIIVAIVQFITPAGLSLQPYLVISDTNTVFRSTCS